MKIIYLILIVIVGVHLAYSQPSKQEGNRDQTNRPSSIETAPQANSVIQPQATPDAEAQAHRKERDAKDDAFRAQQAEQNEIIKIATVVLAVFAALSFVIAVIYAIFAGVQWRTMKNQQRTMKSQGETMRDALQQSEDHFKTANRPVITIDKIKWAEAPRAGMNRGKFWRIGIDMQNLGNTVAHLTVNNATLNVVPYAAMNEKCPDPITDRGIFRNPSMLVAAKGHFSITLEIHTITAEDYDNLWTDSLDKYNDWKRVVLWIDIAYKDGFGEDYVFQHHATFNWVSFVPCPEHCRES